MHPTLIHASSWIPRTVGTTNPTNSKEHTVQQRDQPKSEAAVTAEVKATYANKASFSMAVTLFVSAGGKEKLIYTLLDTLSDITSIDQQIAKDIETDGIADELELVTMNAETLTSTLRY